MENFPVNCSSRTECLDKNISDPVRVWCGLVSVTAVTIVRITTISGLPPKLFWFLLKTNTPRRSPDPAWSPDVVVMNVV